MESAINSLNLQDTLTAIAAQLGINGDKLLGYANELIPPNHHPKRLDNSLAPTGVEGIALYALVRTLHPETVLEVGNFSGNSTRHFIKALRKNRRGHLTTIDNRNWEAVKAKDKKWATSILVDLFAYDYSQIAPIDFVFEDSYHQPDMVEHVWRNFVEHALPGAVIISHDAAHVDIGPGVREGVERVTLDYRVYRIDPALCGFAIGQKYAD